MIDYYLDHVIYYFKYLENKLLKVATTNVVSFVPNGDYYYNKALKALDRGEMDKAYKYIKRAADLSPDDAHVLLQYGILEMELRKPCHKRTVITFPRRATDEIPLDRIPQMEVQELHIRTSLRRVKVLRADDTCGTGHTRLI